MKILLSQSPAVMPFPGLNIALLAAAIFLAMVTGGCTRQQDARHSMDTAELAQEIEAMYAGYRKDFPGIGEISPKELTKLLENGEAVVVDVREPEEQAVSMIPGAITKEEFEAGIEEYRGKRIVTHCTIGYRSGVYTRELEERGIPALNLKGSILAWVNAGQPVVDAEGHETKRVHVYGRRWNLLPEDYEGVW